MSSQIVCPPPLRSRPYVGPSISFVTVQKIALGGAKGDVPLIPPGAFRWLMVTNCDPAHYGDSLWLHFQPLSKVYTANAIIPIGNEPWLPLYAVASGHSKIGMGYLFHESLPTTQLYLDIGQEAGGTDYAITFAFSNNVDDWRLVFQG